MDSIGTEGDGDSSLPSISADGRFVAFQSFARIVSKDTNPYGDIYVRDRKKGKTKRVIPAAFPDD